MSQIQPASGRFTPDELAPITGNPVPDHSLGTIERVANLTTLYNRIHIDNVRHAELMAHYNKVVALGQANAGQPHLAGRTLGPSGSGKTTAALFFKSEYEQRGLHKPGEQPILIVPLDRACTSRRIFTSILDALGDNHAHAGTEEFLKKRAYVFMRKRGVRLLVIDEVQHLAFRSTARNDVTDTLKRFLDDSICPLMLAGTEDAIELLNHNKQLANRVHSPCDLPALSLTDKAEITIFRSYVADLDKALVATQLTRRSSDLVHKRTLSCLHAVTGGVLGRISNLVRQALISALSRSADYIEPHDLATATSNWAVAQGLIYYNPFITGVQSNEHLA